ncbi:MAG: hypothetical protein EAZ89_01945 [Bacteroidetes bacterium]|nr:MAG: hypothetical protein EAZ89_01945 [Bacteroidota bacterium]
MHPGLAPGFFVQFSPLLVHFTYIFPHLSNDYLYFYFHKIQTYMNAPFPKIFLPTLVSACVLSGCLSFPTSSEIGLSFSTQASVLPDSLVCLNSKQGSGFAKELMNPKEKLVVISGGTNPIPEGEWESFNPPGFWQKNIDRFVLFQSSCFYRSPGRPVACKDAECQSIVEISDYTWIGLADIVAVDFVPEEDNSGNPQKTAPGELSLKVIAKCHILTYENEIYDLTDPKGNHYVMHATETGTPDLNVTLPEGWTLSKVTLTAPLEVTPRGGGDECYHVIVGDHLGQGYHQYVFVDDIYPAE